MSEVSLREKVSVESLVARAADDFLERQKNGEKPDIEEYAARYPEAADLLRKVLAALELIGFSQFSGSGLSAMAVEPAGTLGDFRILREVGRGGMGIVYEAEQISLGRRVALKVLPFAATMDPRHLQRFHNEARAAAHLDHPHIVKIHAVGCERGVYYYAMQFIDGQTLAALIRQLRQQAGLEGTDESALPRVAPATAGPTPLLSTPASPEAKADTANQPAAAVSTEPSIRSPAFLHTAAKLAIQAAEALEHAHQLGVVHRDIKPANLLVDGRGNLWIADFGLALCHNQAGLTLTGDLVGTLRYMSPEQARSQRGGVDHRTDIYSLGVTLYELLTLHPIFSDADRQELLQKIAFEEPKPPRRLNKAIPLELETIVLKAIDKNAGERYATAQELADDLRRFLEDKAIRAKRPTLRQRAARWSRRHRTFVMAAVIVLVAAVLGLAIATYLIWRAEKQTAAALKEAQAERQRAEARARDTLEAVDRILHAGQLRLDPQRPAEVERQALVEEALVFYRRLLAENPNDPALRRQTARAYAALGAAHHSLGNLPGAEQAYHQAMQLLGGLIAEFPSEPSYRFLLADTQSSLAQILMPIFDRHPEAEKLFRQAVDAQQALVNEFPQRYDWLIALAETYHGRGYFHYTTSQSEEAEQDYRHALQLYQRAEAASGQGKPTHAQRAFIYNSLGVLLWSTDRLAEAEDAHRNALKLLDEQTEEQKRQSNHERLRSLGRLAILLWWKGQQEEAERYLREVLADAEKQVTTYPRLQEARLNLSLLYRQLGGLLEAAGRPEESDQLYRRARSHQEKLAAEIPTSASYHLQLALTDMIRANLLALRRSPELEKVCQNADAAFRRALALDTKNPDVCNLYARFLANAPSARHRDPARAVELAKQALTLAANDRHYWNTLGMAYYRKGKAKEALAALHKSVELRYGGSCRDHFFLALAYGALGDCEQARHWHQRGVEWLNKTKRGREAVFQRLREESAAALHERCPT